MEMTISVDATDGITISISGEAIIIEQIGEGLLTVGEARLAADLLKVVADHLEASNNGN